MSFDKVNQTGDVLANHSSLLGEWVVMATHRERYGVHGAHALVLRRLLLNSDAIDWNSDDEMFYQSVGFTNEVTLPYIPPIRRLNEEWVSGKEQAEAAEKKAQHDARVAALEKLTPDERRLLNIF